MRARALLLAGVALAAGCRQRPAPPQPVQFDHSLHTALELERGKLACVDCHAGAERGTHAGLPALSYCLRCHMRPQGDPPSTEEREVRLAIARGGPFGWIQVTRNPGHVHFSHGAHVTVGGLECAECHGDVTSWTEPPTTPDPDLTTMSACMSCHRERGVSNDCGTCHQ
jgi:c(7)-type cytochrome triheme protein